MSSKSVDIVRPDTASVNLKLSSVDATSVKLSAVPVVDFSQLATPSVNISVRNPEVPTFLPIIDGVPTISGTAEVGQVLTANAASVSASPPSTRVLRWQRSDNGTSGWTTIQDSSTYTVALADEQKYIRVQQRETNTVGTTVANSASTSQVPVSFEGLLDTYSGATAAYSLRLLRSEYEGSAIRVRRDNDNEEQDIGFKNNDLDTSALAQFCGSSDGYITTWYEQSGASGADDMTQSTASNQPKIYDGASESVVTDNEKPSIEFDYTNTHHFSASPTNWNSIVDDTNHTIIMVYNLNQYNTPRSVIYNITSDAVSSGRGNTHIAMSRSNQLRIGFFNRELTSWTKKTAFVSSIGGAQNGVQYVVTSIYDETELNSFANSTIEDNGISNPEGGNKANKFYIGVHSGGSANPMDGKMQEFIIWNADQTSNRSGIETNINDHYSIY